MVTSHGTILIEHGQKLGECSMCFDALLVPLTSTSTILQVRMYVCSCSSTSQKRTINTSEGGDVQSKRQFQCSTKVVLQEPLLPNSPILFAIKSLV